MHNTGPLIKLHLVALENSQSCKGYYKLEYLGNTLVTVKNSKLYLIVKHAKDF